MNRFQPIFPELLLTLHMRVFRFSIIEAVEEQALGSGNILYGWHISVTGTPLRLPAKIAHDCVRQSIQPASHHIRFELFVPSFGVKFEKPVSKDCKFFPRKLRYGGFEFVYLAHASLSM
jgi:hypothetical protein